MALLETMLKPNLKFFLHSPARAKTGGNFTELRKPFNAFSKLFKVTSLHCPGSLLGHMNFQSYLLVLKIPGSGTATAAFATEENSSAVFFKIRVQLMKLQFLTITNKEISMQK